MMVTDKQDTGRKLSHCTCYRISTWRHRKKVLRISMKISNNPAGISNRYLKHNSTVLPQHKNKKSCRVWEPEILPKKDKLFLEKPYPVQVRNPSSLCQQRQIIPEMSHSSHTVPVIHNSQQHMGPQFCCGGWGGTGFLMYFSQISSFFIYYLYY